jgi:hypothetical protein
MRPNLQPAGGMRQFFFPSAKTRPIAATIPGGWPDQPPGLRIVLGDDHATGVDTVESGPVFCYCHAMAVANAAS